MKHSMQRPKPAVVHIFELSQSEVEQAISKYVEATYPGVIRRAKESYVTANPKTSAPVGYFLTLKVTVPND